MTNVFFNNQYYEIWITDLSVVKQKKSSFVSDNEIKVPVHSIYKTLAPKFTKNKVFNQI